MPMNTTFDMESGLDHLAERLMLAEPSSASDLAELHGLFESLLAWTAENARGELRGACAHAMETIRSIERSEPDEARMLMVELGRAFTHLRGAALAAGVADSPAASSPPCVAAGAVSPDPLPLAGDAELLSDFVARATEHLEDADVHMLTLERAPHDPEALNAVFRAFHTVKGMAGFLGLSAIEAICHEAESVLEGPRRGEGSLASDEFGLIFGHIDAMRERVEAVRLGGSDGHATPATGAPAPRAEARHTLRVYEDRLDGLLDMIGELVIAEASLADRVRASAGTDDALAKQLGTLDAVSRRLQESATALRMIPLTSAFRRLQRLARDVSTKSGKRIECVITGEDTELDKAVVDAIVDPLMHLVRNAVDHGIEDDPVVRECAGKPAAGTVRIHAEQVGSGIHITVSDDGRGFDPAAISRAAAERGLPVPDDAGDAELLELVFAPGFSTAEQVTEISGRGVGLDVVRRTVQSLRGTIDVTSSPGVGTEFRVTLPLTLAIIDAMVVRVAEERYVVPTLSVMRSVRPSAGDITGVLGRAEVLHAEGRFLPLVRLDRLFGIEDAEQDPERAVCVIVRDGERAAALMVCELTGQQQTVIKPLGEGIGRAPGISGGAVMADGGVGLIVDVAGIVRLAAAEGSERR